MDRFPSLIPGIPLPVVFGHRGCSSEAPENTLASFKRCKDLGVHGIEFDVHRCATGELVVVHDHNLTRLADTDAYVEDLSYNELTSLDVGSHFSTEFSSERIPLLDDVFEFGGRNFYYDVEIKSQQREDHTQLSSGIVNTIVQHSIADRCLVSSFNPFRIKEVCRLSPNIATAIIYSNHSDLPRLLRSGFGQKISGCSCIKPHSPLVTPKLIRKRGKYPILPWTVNTAEEAERVITLGCAGIITDRPQDFAAYY